MPTRLFKSYLKNPGLIGSIAPSSSALAAAMSDDCGIFPQKILELGGGTGPITAAIKERYAGLPIQVVEMDERFGKNLMERFPDIDVVISSLHDASHIFDELPEITLIISSLPFKSLPKDVKTPTIKLISHFLEKNPKSLMVQYTYGIGTPFQAPEGLAWRHRRTVLANIPPAQVWELRTEARQENKGTEGTPSELQAAFSFTGSVREMQTSPAGNFTKQSD